MPLSPAGRLECAKAILKDRDRDRKKLRQSKSCPSSQCTRPLQRPCCLATPGRRPQQRFYNRELSWLQFNRRVLEEAHNEHHPLLERLRFLSISASNLDEFYMVRAAGLYGQVTAGIVQTQPGWAHARPAARRDQPVRRRRSSATSRLAGPRCKAEMARRASHIVEPKELTPAEREWLERQFLAHYLPMLTPIAVDPAHPFPFIQNGGLTVGVELRRERDGTTMHALIPIPGPLARFIRLPAGETPPARRILRSASSASNR